MSSNKLYTYMYLSESLKTLGIVPSNHTFYNLLLLKSVIILVSVSLNMCFGVIKKRLIKTIS